MHHVGIFSMVEAGHGSTVRHIPGFISSYNNIQILGTQFRSVSKGQLHKTFKDKKNTILYKAQSPVPVAARSKA